MKTDTYIRPAVAAAAFAIAAMTASSASAAGFNFFSLYNDGTQAYNSRTIAGAAPNALATYQGGIRCHYEYRVQWNSYGSQRVRVEICN